MGVCGKVFAMDMIETNRKIEKLTPEHPKAERVTKHSSKDCFKRTIQDLSASRQVDSAVARFFQRVGLEVTLRALVLFQIGIPKRERC